MSLPMLTQAALFLLALFLLLAPLLVHEAAHWAALRAYGRSVRHLSLGTGPRILRTRAISVHLFPLAGGITLSSDFDDLPWRERFVTAVAGPLASSAYASALLMGTLSLVSPTQADALFRIGLLSLFLSVFNLLPLPCLDGFQAMKALAEGLGMDPRKWRCQACGHRWWAALVLIAAPAFWLCVELWA